ncbi:MAG: RNA-binding S4 domain-containing protein [Rhodobacteraceae bacterium]|jgi:ribosome-associated heat shock protein Hsp15|nr:RNA-binding S4 domain-containing protein [Paracoccaceae bacterium]
MAARPGPPPPAAALRLDKWLFVARFFRSRAAAAAAVAAGRVRLNGLRIDKPARQVAPGDTLTLVHAGRVRVVRVLALGLRRGTTAEAATLWRDLDAPDPSQAPVLE